MWQTPTAPQGFAGILAALAVPPPAGPVALEEEPDWTDDGLLDDVAVISQQNGSLSQMREPDADSRSVPTPEAAARTSQVRKQPRPERNENWHASSSAADKFVSSEVNAPAKNRRARELKQASITIRLSAQECARLKARAAESGLTISEYLRSCTLEAESLRAQVKDALARLRAPAVAERSAAPVQRQSQPRSSLLRKMTHIWPLSKNEQHAAGA